MPGVSPEALLISALINNSSVGAETRYGISVADFEGYRDEYNWLHHYLENFGSQPSHDIFSHKFGSFPFSTHDNIQAACQMVHEASNRRRLTTGVTQAMDQIHLGDTEGAYQILMSAEPRRAAPAPHDLLTDTSHLEEWDHPAYAVELPYGTLQRHTGGIRAGNLWYVAGRPGQGKSAHLTVFGKHGVLAGNRVLMYSLEMSEEEVRARFHASLATSMGYPSITLTNLRSHNVDRKIYQRFHGELAERMEACGGVLHIHTPKDGPVSPAVVASRCGEYQLTIVDYIGLMATDGRGAAIDDWREMAKISNRMKIIALSQQTAILAAAQINRDGETGSAPPKVKNLAQSDALGQDADVVLTLRAKPHNVATAFSLEKNRHGPSGIRFYTTFDPNTGVFTEISGDHAEDLVINAEALDDSAPPSVAAAPRLRVIKSKDEL
jgi:replicative DNA helicase